MAFPIPFWYSVGVKAYGLGIKVASLRDAKAKLWLSGRKNWRSRYSELLKDLKDPIWIHCASLGEFEQGRPLIEALRADRPQEKIVLTFFSPSGYEIRKDYDKVDAVLYLPLDSQSNAQDFIQLLQPKAAIFVKYETWLHHLNELDKNGVNRYLISAIFRSGQVFEKAMGKSFLKALKGYQKIFVQDEESANYISSLGAQDVLVSGDTRLDRVHMIRKEAEKIPALEKWKKNHSGPVLVGGSTWKEDEEILEVNWSGPLIIAPHDVSEIHINELLKLFPGAEKLSTLSNYKTRVLIVDSIGLLSQIYQYGDAAFIGGGFGEGIHNTLEPAVWGLPVFFGPKYDKFKEARDLKELGAAFSIDRADDWGGLPLPFRWKELGQRSKKYVEKNQGATEIILQHLELH
jgi:3-deoxy-D-manno-octulosonic-acid transferase